MGIPSWITDRSVKPCFTERFIFMLTVLLTVLVFNQIK